MQTRGHKADFAHFLIESGEQLLSLFWPAADARRAASLEIIARTAYTAEEVLVITLRRLASIRAVLFVKLWSWHVGRIVMSRRMKTFFLVILVDCLYG
jgi:hypothetical protein